MLWSFRAPFSKRNPIRFNLTLSVDFNLPIRIIYHRATALKTLWSRPLWRTNSINKINRRPPNGLEFTVLVLFLGKCPGNRKTNWALFMYRVQMKPFALVIDEPVWFKRSFPVFLQSFTRRSLWHRVYANCIMPDWDRLPPYWPLSEGNHLHSPNLSWKELGNPISKIPTCTISLLSVVRKAVCLMSTAHIIFIENVPLKSFLLWTNSVRTKFEDANICTPFAI